MEWLQGAIIGAIVGRIAGGLGVLIMALVMPRRKCPDCGEVFPRFRNPANSRQALWGGGTCTKCGCEVDRRGRKIEKD
jgi:hypothetical protein